MRGRIPPVNVPDEFRVFAASDLHGQLRATDHLLAAAGLTDGGDRWLAPPATALVITGDMVDRGPDSVGLVRRLVSLRDQAPARGGLVVLLEGNHEVQVLGGLDGVPLVHRAVMTFGGAATLLSAGLTEDDWLDRPAAEIAARFDRAVPDLRRTLWGFAPYARWRDTLLVHGGPVPGQDLDAFEASSRRLWIRRAFFEAEARFPDAEPWRPYRLAGARQVVFGHTSVAEPTLFHGNRAINLDTWRGQTVTLARLPESGDLRDAEIFSTPAEPRAVADADVTREQIALLDEAITSVVDEYWEAAKGPDREAGAG
jgi:serine/threonine protein phosphatase 1